MLITRTILNNIKPILNTDIICNYKNIENYFIKSYDNIESFYISSKTKYSNRWNLLKETFNITSNWTNINKRKENMSIDDKQDAWP